MRQRIILLVNGTNMLNFSYSTWNHNYILLPTPFSLGCCHLTVKAYRIPQFSFPSVPGRGTLSHRSWAWVGVPQVSIVSRIHLAGNQLVEAFPSALECVSSYLWSPSSPYSSLPLLSPWPRCPIWSTHPPCYPWNPYFVTCQWDTKELVDIIN